MNSKKMNASASCFVDDYNALVFIIESMINKIGTVELVRVENVNADNTIDIIPIVRNVNTEDNPIEESVIYGVRYLMWQYGGNAIKATPEVGDVGLIVACKKDISNVENGIVGSFRKFNLADGIYIGGIFGLNQQPTQFIEFSNSGINITSTSNLTINAQSATINATEVNLGGVGGQGVARIGDEVVVGGIPGVITGGSTIVKAL